VLADEAEVPGAGGDEVALDRHHDLGLGDPVQDVHGAPEREERARARGVTARGVPLVPLGLRERGQEAADLRGQRGRGDGLGEDADPRAAAPRLRDEDRAHGRDEGVPGPDLSAIGERLRAVRVVEVQDLGLGEEVGRAEARRVLGVALDLGGPALVALHEHTFGVTLVEHGGGEEEGPARDQLLGLAHVRNDRLVGLPRAAGQSGQRDRRTHHAQELAPALRVVEFRGPLGELAVQARQELRRVPEVVEALPEAAPAVPAAALQRDGNGRHVVRAAHR
jgi:hypothetical protein